MPRLTKEDQRLLVAEALRNLAKLDLLEDSDLVDLLEIAPSGDGFWPRANTLCLELTSIAQRVVRKLEGHERYEPHRELLLAILEGSTVAAWARTRGVSREYVSKTFWKPVTQLVAQEIFAPRKALSSVRK